MTYVYLQGPIVCKESPTLCCSFMILLEWVEYFFSKKNQKHLTNSKPLKPLLKMKRRQKSNVLDQKMVVISPQKSFISYVKHME
jgi:hypothetical protein